MELKSKYKLVYTLNKEEKSMILEVELRENDGLRILGRNVWTGYARLNGQEYLKEDLSHCVNARFAAERIGHKLREELKSQAKKDGQVFRIKKEETI